MGGILGNEAWRRSNGGLWLPRVFGMPETAYGWCCCGETESPCECDCENCAPINGEHINNAPCCWTVTVSNIKPADPLKCEDCDCINYTYYLSQDTGEDANPCLWRGRACNMCTIGTEITLEVIDDGGVHKIVVTLGDYVWSREYESPPECCNISKHGLTLKSSGDGCDATQSGCTISSGRTPWSPNAECATPCCNNCAAELPKRLSLHLTGVDNADPAVCTTCHCLNRHWCLQRSCGCTWKGSIYSIGHCIGGYVYADLVYEGGDYILRVTYGTAVWEKNYGTIKPDCAAFDEEELTLISNFDACDLSGSTMTVSAGTADCRFQTQECKACACGLSPDAMMVTISGVADGGCTDCEDVNGTYIFPVSLGQLGGSDPCQFWFPVWSPETSEQGFIPIDCPNGGQQWIKVSGVVFSTGFHPSYGPKGYLVGVGVSACGGGENAPRNCQPWCYDDAGNPIYTGNVPYEQTWSWLGYQTSPWDCINMDNYLVPPHPFAANKSTCCDFPLYSGWPPYFKNCPNAFCDFTVAEVRITAIYL